MTTSGGVLRAYTSIGYHDRQADRLAALPHRAIEFRKFLQMIERDVPRGLAIHASLDNSSTLKTRWVEKRLGAHPRLVVHFTPTSSSWLNLVERWFAVLTSKLPRRGAHRSVQALNSGIPLLDRQLE